MPTDQPVPELDISFDGLAQPADEDAEAKAVFHLRMRARGVRDLAVLRALERVPRHMFVPQRHRELAGRDLPIPIDCGQTLEASWLTARMIEALRIERGHRVLEIGAGSGYATALLAQLCAEVFGVERFKSLATVANARLAELCISNAAVAWADGLNLPATAGQFDRILVHGVLDGGRDHLLARLSDAGAIICATDTSAGQVLVRLGLASDDTTVILEGCRLQPLQHGLAATL